MSEAGLFCIFMKTVPVCSQTCGIAAIGGDCPRTTPMNAPISWRSLTERFKQEEKQAPSAGAAAAYGFGLSPPPYGDALNCRLLGSLGLSRHRSWC